MIRGLDEPHYADTLEARAVGFVQLLEQHAEIRSQFFEGPLWRRGHKTKRMGVRLSAESGSQLFVGAVVGRYVQRHRERHVGLWDERRSDRSQFQEKYRRTEKGGLAGSRRDLSRRNQRILEIAGHHARRDEADSNDRVSFALRGICRKSRLLHPIRRPACREELRLAGAPKISARPGGRSRNFSEGPRTLQ